MKYPDIIPNIFNNKFFRFFIYAMPLFVAPMSVFPQAMSEVTNIDSMLNLLTNSKDDTNFLRFCGANRPLYILRKGEIIEFGATNQTLGIISEYNAPFELHTVPLEQGDSIYLFTDGYADQFGGPKNKKFLTKRFKEMLLSNSGNSMAEQKLVIEKTFDEWRGKQKQVDDICVIGLRV